MTHLPFVAGSYAIGVLLPAAYGIAAWRRMRLARRRLAAIPRGRRSGTDTRPANGNRGHVPQ
jgi:hypothetical protein